MCLSGLNNEGKPISSHWRLGVFYFSCLRKETKNLVAFNYIVEVKMSENQRKTPK